MYENMVLFFQSSEVREILEWLAIGLTAYIVVLLVLFVGFILSRFPRKCEKCGKWRAVKIVRDDTATVYSAGGLMVSSCKLSYKVCVNCNHTSDPIFGPKKEYIARG